MHLNEGAAAVIAVGVVVLWQLVRIRQELESSRLVIEKLQGMGEDIAKELKWYKDITGDLHEVATDVLSTLSTIEDNTSPKD